MNKKDLLGTITTASARTRMTHIIEAAAREKFGREPIFSDTELEFLSATFTKPNEITLYDKFKELDEVITGAITNLQSKTLEVRMHNSNLRGYILLWDSYQTTEVITNSILDEIKDLDERKRIANNASALCQLLFTTVNTDQEGYLEIDIDPKTPTGHKVKGQKAQNGLTFWKIINNVKNNAERTVVEFLSWRKATLDFMHDEGFNIKTYKEMIDEFTEMVYTPVINWTKYLSDTTSFIPDTQHHRADKMKKLYAVTPDVNSLEIDQEIYDSFEKSVLYG